MLLRSLQGRLLAMLLAAALVVWAAAGLLAWDRARTQVDELLDGHLSSAAALLVARGAGEIDDDGDGPIEPPPPLRYARAVAFQVWHEGRLALRSDNAPLGPMSTQIDGFETRTVAGVRWRIFGARGAEDDIQVWVGEQLDSRSAIVQAVLGGLLWPMAIALPLLGLAAWAAVRAGLAPLRRLSAALAGRATMAESPVTLSDAPLEMRPLVEALNDLLGRIGALVSAERRFTADAAHELRTPIAAIRAQAQAALGAADDAERRRTLNSTVAGCDRASRLVDQLLTLARLEADTPCPKEEADLALLARETLAEAAGSALARDQDIGLAADPSCRVRAGSALLGVLIRNLVDNAIRYSPNGARIRVAVERVGDRVRLRVDDSGPGLTDADRQRLGERFFRVLGPSETGSGLGWSIVRRIARAQGAQVEVARSAELGGLAVTVTWPAIDSGPAPSSAAPPEAAPASASAADDQMQRPPSTSIATPVIIDASSLQR
jgi:two-component system sensor histidine kinase QseC